ncbi:MAG TPA: DinB family protein [Chloroflexota bacterium]|nr:DinB family protein [Chloroflexota bacterium]
MSERCAECNFDWGTSTLEGLRIIDRLPRKAREVVEEMGSAAYHRSDPAVWSPNEYVWHLADTFRLAAEWLHDMRTREHPTHYAVDNDALAAVRGYDQLPVELGLWSLDQSCDLFISEAGRTDPARTCFYDGWRDVNAGEVVSFLTHEAAHHLKDLERLRERDEVSHVQ